MDRDHPSPVLRNPSPGFSISSFPSDRSTSTLTKTVITISETPPPPNSDSKLSCDPDHKNKHSGEQDFKHSGDQDQASHSPDIPVTSTKSEEDPGSTVVGDQGSAGVGDQGGEDLGAVETVSRESFLVVLLLCALLLCRIAVYSLKRSQQSSPSSYSPSKQPKGGKCMKGR